MLIKLAQLRLPFDLLEAELTLKNESLYQNRWLQILGLINAFALFCSALILVNIKLSRCVTAKTRLQNRSC